MSIGFHAALALISYSPRPQGRQALPELRFEVEAITGSSDSAATVRKDKTSQDQRKNSPARVVSRSEQPRNIPAPAEETAAREIAGHDPSHTTRAAEEFMPQPEASASILAEPDSAAAFGRSADVGTEVVQNGKESAGMAGGSQGSAVNVAVTRAAYRFNPNPDYPEIAWREGWEGTVVLEIVIGANGHPERVAVARSSGFAVLDRAAREAARKWRFSPASVGGERVSSVERIPVVFKLTGPD